MKILESRVDQKLVQNEEPHFGDYLTDICTNLVPVGGLRIKDRPIRPEFEEVPNVRRIVNGLGKMVDILSIGLYSFGVATTAAYAADLADKDDYLLGVLAVTMTVAHRGYLELCTSPYWRGNRKEEKLNVV